MGKMSGVRFVNCTIEADTTALEAELRAFGAAARRAPKGFRAFRAFVDSFAVETSVYMEFLRSEAYRRRLAEERRKGLAFVASLGEQARREGYLP